VGAPLGAIIRKGGLGLPMVIAIVLFLTYYFIGVFAENYAKEGNMSPILGAWISTLIMLPLGIYLTKRATADKGLLSFGNIIDFFQNLISKKRFSTK
jgi:lipopolysaccharide export system permease protein